MGYPCDLPCEAPKSGDGSPATDSAHAVHERENNARDAGFLACYHCHRCHEPITRNTLSEGRTHLMNLWTPISFGRFLAVSVLALMMGSWCHAGTDGTLAAERPRVIVSTDIGGSDNDDYQSMVHFLIYADRFEIEGLVSSPPGAGRSANLNEVIDAYEKDFPRLRAHAPGYPAPDALRGVVRQGATDPAPAEGFSAETEGSRLLIERALANDERPLYVLVWGSITDVAQAVHDDPAIKENLRIYSIGSWNTGQDRAARDYLYQNHPDVWWVEADTTFRGMYVGGNQGDDLDNRAFPERHVSGRGALGQLFMDKLPAIKMGDTPSVLYLLSGDPGDPTVEHWGGSFVPTDHGPHYWTDSPDPALAERSYPGAKTVNRWREAYLRDWAARMEWTLEENASDAAFLINPNGWFVHGDAAVWGWMQHNGWWRPGQRPNLARRSVGDPLGDVRPNRTEDLGALTDSMLRYGYPGFEHNYGLWYDRRRDAHDVEVRTDANAVPPFLEQPWARSDEGQAADGLPKYDLTRFNPWYFERLKAFADLCDRKGTVFFHKFYMQHALLETQAHYIDFPWRPGNCLQDTGMPEAIPAANAFYDVSNPVRRDLHRRYIRQCLDVLGGNERVVFQISEEYTGPLSFMQFWQDTIAEWEQEHERKVHIGLGATRDVQEAILADAARADAIDVLDLRYWWIKEDGTLYAPEGGREVPGRDFDQGGRQAAECPPERIYEKTRSYRDRYPAKAIIDAIEGDRQQCWAFLMAGGSMLVRGGISYPDNADPIEYIQPAGVDIILPTYRFLRDTLSKTLPEMRPRDMAVASTDPTWCLAEEGGAILAYALRGGTFQLDLTSFPGDYTARWFNPRTGDLVEAGETSGGRPLEFEAPSEEDWVLWLDPQVKP